MCSDQPQGASRSCRGTVVLRGLRSGPSGGLFTPPSPFLWLPRVHAAERAPPLPPSPSFPSNLCKPALPDTGWERIKEVFHREQNQPYSEEVSNITKGGLMGALVGMLYGGVPAAQHAKRRFIQMSQAEIYQSRVEAVRLAHNAAIRGFVRYGWRWSWRVATFVTLFNTVSTGLSVYRDKDALSHFAVAGAVTGGLFRMTLGLRGLVAGTVIGTFLGVPAGALVTSIQKLGGETLRERSHRERLELHEHQMAEWTARLQLTDDLIGEIRDDRQGQALKADLQRIDELLSQPRNEGVAEDSGSQ